MCPFLDKTAWRYLVIQRVILKVIKMTMCEDLEYVLLLQEWSHSENCH